MSDTSSAAPIDARIVIFVGGVLRDTIQHGEVECRPPATRGDLTTLMREAPFNSDARPLKVGIIDGTIHGPSVPPKEVMSAMGAGVQMYGAVGDGALRAAECASYGMTGVGRIFVHATTQLISPLDEYRTPDGGGLHDQSIAAWHLALTDAAADGTATDGDVHTFLSTARQVPWRQRTLARVLASADHDREQAQRIKALLSEARRHVMRQDALTLVQAMLDVN